MSATSENFYKLLLADDNEPLKGEKHGDEVAKSLEEECLKMSKGCALTVGGIVGAFLEGAVLGLFCILSANEVYLVDGLGKFSGKELRAAIIFIWCVITALMAMAICKLFKSLIAAVFASTCLYDETTDDQTKKRAELITRKIIMIIDIWYCFGCLCGMTLCWSVTYNLLGVQKDFFDCLWVVMFAFFYWVVVWTSAKVEMETEEEDTPTEGEDTADETEESDRAPAIETAVPFLDKECLSASFS
ncbi:expressed unknown protein [Seminavis robusta]|uniref:Uncharacterized protein n=1 Tax=Seminavis robusta TaxID=568900 RepID=A0A9N8ERF3_9STRA|nr:expressed unknown protein [Seminavis robusta]|eukprot:Sro1625_g286760.1 n/a (245) ;mRNA; f:11265-11999